jgi:hypothetical protein
VTDAPTINNPNDFDATKPSTNSQGYARSAIRSIAPY